MANSVKKQNIAQKIDISLKITIQEIHKIGLKILL